MHYPTRSALVRPRQWLRAHQSTADATLAAAVFAVILLGTVLGPDTYRLGPLDAALAALACTSLAMRRRVPWTVLGFTCVMSALFIVLRPADGRVPVVLAAAVSLCTVAARTDRPTTWATGLAACVGLTALAMAFGSGPWYGQANFAVFAWTGMAAAAGDSVRSRRAYIAAIEERAVRAERSREEETKRRVAEERMRIARDLHDVVAHHIALVNVQAGVAAHVMDSRPDQAKQALAHVREASRSALNELRATVGLLRQSGEPEAPMEPTPGLGVLDQLLDGFRRAGLRVTVQCEGTRPAVPLPASVDLTAYRVIQESLTNVQKHAGPDAGAVVRIIHDPAELEVVVDDDGVAGVEPVRAVGPQVRRAAARARSGRAGVVQGSGPAPEVETGAGVAGSGAGSGAGVGGSGAGSGSEAAGSSGSAAGSPSGAGAGSGPPGSGSSGPASSWAAAGPGIGGHGLLGMHERASALGGSCRTGARPGGGFRVRVRLPLSAPPRPSAADGVTE